MKPRVCICCGELMSEKGSALSRNPNVCASCSSLLDGADDLKWDPALAKPTMAEEPPSVSYELLQASGTEKTPEAVWPRSKAG